MPPRPLGVCSASASVLSSSASLFPFLREICTQRPPSHYKPDFVLLFLLYRQALYDEQLEYHGDGNGGFTPLTYETLQTPLLAAFIKEVLRVHPPLHSVMRKVVNDFPVPAIVASPAAEPGLSRATAKSLEGFQYTIPKGNFVLVAPGFTMVDPRIWKDAKKFDETRWMEGKSPVDAELDEEGDQEDFGWGEVVSSLPSFLCSFFWLTTLCLFRARVVDLPVSFPYFVWGFARSATDPEPL